MPAPPIKTALLVEDSEDDEFFFKHALAKAGFNIQVCTVRDAKEAITFLKGEGRFSDHTEHPFPDLIITDLKMAGLSGFDLLQWLKSQHPCALAPIIVMSSSFAPTDISEAYRLGANAFVSKPGDLEGLAETLTLILRFWSLCERPLFPPDLRC